MCPMRSLTISPLAFVLALVLTTATPQRQVQAEDGMRPTDATGRALNLDFETGDLRDWTAQGEAFQGPPIEGDAVAARRGDMKSRHTGKFWVGSFERAGDAPRGTLTSASFKLTRPFARFLIGGGGRDTTRLEIVKAADGKVVYKVSGDNTEDMKPIVADLSAHQGETVFIRLVDDDGGGWGHLNFDDFSSLGEAAPGRGAVEPGAADQFMHQGLSPTEAAAAMTTQPGFKVTLYAGEPDVVQPIAFTIDDRGRLWVVESYSYPIRLPEAEARDRILIFEDTDGDGKFDTRKVFHDKLNLVSGIEVGFGGVWVGAAPEFLFIPDKDGDDKPDGARRPARRLGVPGHPRDPELVQLGPRRLALRLPRRLHPLARRQARNARRRPHADQRRDLAVPPHEAPVRGLRPRHQQPLGRRLRRRTARPS